MFMYHGHVFIPTYDCFLIDLIILYSPHYLMFVQEASLFWIYCAILSIFLIKAHYLLLIILVVCLAYFSICLSVQFFSFSRSHSQFVFVKAV